MNKEEALIYIWDILEEYYHKSNDDEAGILLGDLDPNPIRLNIGTKTADPAAWNDWLDAVNMVTPNDYLTEAEAIKAIIALMEEYSKYHGYDLKKAIEYFKSSSGI
jgi:hypothetical protein